MINRKTAPSRLRRLLGVLLSCCFVLLLGGSSPASAAALFDTPRWDIPFLGIMTGPAGFKAVELVDWVNAMDAAMEKQGVPRDRKDAWKKEPLALPDDFRIYQLQVNDGSAYHIAFAFACYDIKGLAQEFVPYFNPVLTNNQQKLLAAINGQLESGVQAARVATASSGFMQLKVLDLKVLDRMKGSKEIIYTASGRVILDMQDFVVPFYVKGYVLQRNGKMALVLIAAEDSDGRFWDKASAQLLNSLEPRRSLLDK
ncbi:MAG TPA: hypothetical protein PKA10_08910 [Selenomonadales bacterium]|nr:hypothetical protein [Selenomonadales bacterium]